MYGVKIWAVDRPVQIKTKKTKGVGYYAEKEYLIIPKFLQLCDTIFLVVCRKILFKYHVLLTKQNSLIHWEQKLIKPNSILLKVFSDPSIWQNWFLDFMTSNSLFSISAFLVFPYAIEHKKVWYLSFERTVACFK